MIWIGGTVLYCVKNVGRTAIFHESFFMLVYSGGMFNVLDGA